MKLYLLTFKQGSKLWEAWHRAPNAGDAINMLEDKGVEIITTHKIKVALEGYIEKGYPDLDFVIKLLQTDIRYKELQPELKQIGLVKLCQDTLAKKN